MGRRFVSCDWGTSNFRLRLVEDGEVRGEYRSSEGVMKLATSGQDRKPLYVAALDRALAHVNAPADLPILISGMASSGIGWKELPYARLPFALDGSSAVIDRIDPRTWLVSGLRSETEILRGEETEALGVVAMVGHEMPFESTLILPGTHSKHLDVNPGGIGMFRTFMTGELFEVLGSHSVLRFSTDVTSPLHVKGFRAGVEESTRKPLTSALFRVRTRTVLDHETQDSNTSFMSGLLIGAELGTLRGSDVPIIVAAGERMLEAYGLAGEVLDLKSRMRLVDSEPALLRGQALLLERILSGK